MSFHRALNTVCLKGSAKELPEERKSLRERGSKMVLSRKGILLVSAAFLSIVGCNDSSNPSSPSGSSAPAAPALASPSNNASGVGSNAAFSWASSSGAASYRIQLSVSPTFSQQFSDQAGIGGTSYSATGLSANTSYYWHVSASNAAGNSGWSDTWVFTTGSSGSGDDAVFSNTKYGVSFSYSKELLTYLENDSILSSSGATYTLVDIGSMLYIDTTVFTLGSISLDVAWPMPQRSATDMATSTRSSLSSGSSYLSTDTAKINGYTASKVYYTYSSSGGLAMKSVWATIYSNSTIFLITAACQTSGFPKFQTDVLNKIWSTVKIVKGTSMAKRSAAVMPSTVDMVMKQLASMGNDRIEVRR